MNKDSKSLELSCYVIGFGAFGVFFRWMQLMLAFNSEGLVDSSAWNILVPAIVIAAAVVFYRFAAVRKKSRMYLPHDFCRALSNEGKLYSICRWAFGGLLCVGSILLIIECETDKDAGFLFALAGAGIVSGIAFPFFLASANKPHVENKNFIALLAAVPVIFFGIWLLTCYKQNTINPIGWIYAVELAAIVIALLAFFRLAGFAYGTPREWKCMVLCMLGAMLCIMTLADSRYLGQQIMFVAIALMQLLCNWIIIANLKQGTKESPVVENDGFEVL